VLEKSPGILFRRNVAIPIPARAETLMRLPGYTSAPHLVLLTCSIAFEPTPGPETRRIAKAGNNRRLLRGSYSYNGGSSTL